MKTRTNENERVMIFIDIRNVLDCFEDMAGKGLRLDFEDMVDRLVGDRAFVAAYVFDGRRRTGDDPSVRFHDAFRSKGFRVIAREIFGPDEDSEEDRKIQKEVDVALASKMIEQAFKDNYDTAVVVSGDRDFRPAVETVQDEGKRVEVAGFSYGMSPTLRRCCDEFRDLDTMQIISLVSIPGETGGEEIPDGANAEEATADAE